MIQDNYLFLQNITKQILNYQVINDLSISFLKHKKVSIIGETGSGKSTLLKIIAGLEQQDEGNVYLNGQKIKTPNDQLIPGNKEIAYLSQHFELKNNYYIKELLSYSNELNENYAAKLYCALKIDHLLNRWTDELSGGEKQRVALALLLTSKPEVLLLDEPFSNLDNNHKQLIASIIDQLSNEFKFTVIKVSHDILDVLEWSDEILVLQNGKIIQRGTPADIFFKPVNEYTAGLLGKFNLIDKGSVVSSLITDINFPSDKKLLLRPSFLKIKNKNEGKINGFIKNIKNAGIYSLLTLDMHDQSITVQIENSNYQIGDEVSISYAFDHVCFL
jgi:iron(III) transport system ATP-binding protein